MSWENIIKNAKDPRKHQFEVLVTVRVDSIDEDLVDYHMEQGTELMRNIHEEIIDDIQRKIGNETSALTIDIDDIEDDMDDLTRNSLSLDNRVDVRVSEVSMTSRDSRYPSY
jgi:hypothetical protein|tara:strand:- start:16262 stop:16597 length:336 start_codon:yes stop_codon:yes gene_type:complete